MRKGLCPICHCLRPAICRIEPADTAGMHALLPSERTDLALIAPADSDGDHPKAEQSLDRELAAHPETKYAIDAAKVYTLAELIDLAQQHNPETRVAWEQAKARAASLGIARASFYPTLTAVALAATTRVATLIGEYFHRQTLGVFEPTLHVDYLWFDFGGRRGAIDVAKD